MGRELTREERLEGDLEALRKENEQMRHERNEAVKKLRSSARTDLRTEAVLRRMESAIDSHRVTYEPVKFAKSKGTRSAQEMAILYSDLHASEVVRPEGTRGINEYNWDVMQSRMADIQQGILSHKEHFGFEVSKLNVWMLGDMLSGDIHDELAITNDRPTVDAVVDLAYDHERWLLGFTEHFPKIKVSGISGNHPRFAVKPSAKQYHNNADYLFYKLLEALLRNHPQFEFDIPRSAMNVQMVADRWRILLMHGDGIRTTMPGVPWGGVHRRVTTLEAQFSKARQPLDYVAFGHWHTTNSLDGIEARTLMNGSVKGADEYSLQKFGSGRDASQLLTTFHPKRGLTGMYPLDLQGHVPASEGWE